MCAKATRKNLEKEFDKAYNRRADIPPAVRRALSAGTRQSRTLSEFLVIDLAKLFSTILPQASVSAKRLSDPKLKLTQRMVLGGELLAEQGDKQIERCLQHGSDTVRGWAAFAIAARTRWSFARCIETLRPAADDSHFGVREWAWMALRPRVAADLDNAIRLLKPWTGEESPNLRRFVSEVTRPRGVWCKQLIELTRNPELGLPLLEPLACDDTKYVRDSVGNWLNDAAKTQPAWVREICSEWHTRHGDQTTAYIRKKALRSLR